jgi:hypothetical protein
MDLNRLAALAGMTLVHPIVEADDEPKDDKPTDLASALAVAKSVKIDIPKDKDGNDLPARLKIVYDGGVIFANASGDKVSLEFEDAAPEAEEAAAE